MPFAGKPDGIPDALNSMTSTPATEKMNEPHWLSRAAGAAKTTLPLQLKERRTKSATDIVYQVLWPKERKGEAVLLHKAAGRAPGGSLFTPPDRLRI